MPKRIFLRLGAVLPWVVALLWSSSAFAQGEQLIWADFVTKLKAGRVAESDLRPLVESTRNVMVSFLGSMRGSAKWPEWDVQPEVHRVGRLVHFLLPLTENGAKREYCFTFIEEHGAYYLHHFESIVLRLDRLPALPASTFPDLAEDKKAWMREENYWSQMVVVFRLMSAAKGQKAAFDLFRDGQGYLLQARTWVPFFEPAKAFIVYLCWEQSRLRGNAVTLETLSAAEAVVRLEPIFLRLYKQTSHLRRLVPEDDYRRIFDTIWQDRATAAGWTVSIGCEGARCTLRFTRAAGGDQ